MLDRGFGTKHNCNIMLVNYIHTTPKGLAVPPVPDISAISAARYNFILKTQYLEKKKVMRLTVNCAYIQQVRNFLGEVPRIKCNGCVGLYFLLAYLNSSDVFQVSRSDLASTLNVSEKTISEFTKVLVGHKLLDTPYTTDINGHRHNSYVIQVLPCNGKSRGETFDFSLSHGLWLAIHKKTGAPEAGKTVSPPVTGSQSQHSDNVGNHASVLLDGDFRDSFLNNYTELRYPNGVCLGGLPVWQSDGRIHHAFHTLSKEAREANVLWDGEHVVEVWDLHNAFFVLLYGHLLSKGYDKPEDVIKFGEAALSGQLYDMVQQHFLSLGYKVSRDRVKEILNRYKNTTKDKLLYASKKQPDNIKRRGGASLDWLISRAYYYNIDVVFLDYNNGNMQDWQKECVSRHLVRCIDEYFESRFPTVRNYILNYKTREEINADGKVRTKSNLQRDITPLEFRFVSNGICRVLFEKYGIKCLTVHDAIYVRQSNAQQIRDLGIDLDELLSKLVVLCKQNSLF